MKYWIIVASKDHVLKGKEGGFCQACHGKEWPLEKMKPGDGVLFYSSKETFGSSKPYQKFTAVGKIKEGDIYQTEMEPGFKPYRRELEFQSCREVTIHPLLGQLHLVDDPKKWGYKFMNGFLEIDKHDFKLILTRMIDQSPKKQGT